MKRRNLAEKAGAVYARNPKLEAAMIAGSVSRGWEDEYSDIELHLFWKEELTKEDRLAAIKQLKGDIIDFHAYEEEEWSESFWCEGVKFEISSFLTRTVTRIVDDVTVQLHTCLDKQCLAASVQNGLPLYGEKVIAGLKNKSENYPEGLRVNFLLENLEFGGRWSNRHALLAREDWLMLYQVMTSVQVKIMGALFALNRMYVHHPAYKWQLQSLKRMKIVQKDAGERLRKILISHPREGLPELETLVQELFGLVKEELPQLDVSSFKEKSLFVRS